MSQTAVETTPVETIEETPDETNHFACCRFEQMQAAGLRVYALCGKDVTVEDVSYAPVTCQPCIKIENAPYTIDPVTGRCSNCIQDLLGEVP